MLPAHTRDHASLLPADLSNTVIVLPRVVPQVHDTGYQRSAGVDPLSWGVPELAAMVTSFTQLSGASTLPSLEEWRVLPDKVSCSRNSLMPLTRAATAAQHSDASECSYDATATSEVIQERCLVRLVGRGVRSVLHCRGACTRCTRDTLRRSRAEGHPQSPLSLWTLLPCPQVRPDTACNCMRLHSQGPK